MEQSIKLGEIIREYRVEGLFSRGFLAETYEVTHTGSGKKYIMKVFLKGAGSSLTEYTNHLLEMQKSLSALSFPSIVAPIDSGEFNGFFYQVFEFIIGKSLRELIKEKAPMHPIDALEVTAQVASALNHLVESNLIHGDLKPENILLSYPHTSELQQKEMEVHLIDFGMVKYVDPEDAILWVGTYRYAPPELRSNVQEVSRTETDRSKLRLRARVGPYLDVYALGVVALEMLTGVFDRPRPLTEIILTNFLAEKNSTLLKTPKHFLQKLSNLLYCMLTLEPSHRYMPKKVYNEAISLINQFEKIEITDKVPRTTQQVTSPAEVSKDADAIATGIAKAIESLRAITESLATTSAIMLKTTEKLEPMWSVADDSHTLEAMDTAFKNLMAKTKISWRIGVTMSIVCFCLILGMILCSVTLAVVTGKPTWSLIFGGASVPLIIGTIVWRPYDRIFRATILSQQIETIHLHSTAVFRSTNDFEERMKIFREAMASLEALFDKHLKP